MERTEKFIEELKRNDVEVYLTTTSSLNEDLNEFFKKQGIKRVFVRPRGLVNQLSPDIEFTEKFDEDVDAGLSEADFGIAYSGGLVELAESPSDKLPSLLPDIHIALLKESNILDDFDVLFENIPHPLPDITFIVGPSKTADIEKILVKGAHGPRRVIVFIVR